MAALNYAQVSIHTPTKGVTLRSATALQKYKVSIHTPTKGVTNQSKLVFSIWRCFNPHTHEGCDPNCISEQSTRYVFQSTHPRRVWLGIMQEIDNIMRFQSTHPRRVWPFSRWHRSFSIKFQSTHPRRVWLYPLLALCGWGGFNPHTHEGCDLLSAGTNTISLKFQSTHPRRVWPIHRWRADGLIGFNPHTHEGCDDRLLPLALMMQGFNPHTHEGCDSKKHGRCGRSRRFQSTHPRRVWQTPTENSSIRLRFQSTHPRRVWPSSLPMTTKTTMFQSTHPRRVWLQFCSRP